MKCKIVCLLRLSTLVFICFLVSAFCNVATLYAGFTLLDGKVHIGGFMRNDSAWRVRHGSNAQEGLEPWDLVLCRNTFQLEIEYKATDWLTIFAIPRG